jgi:hypothetical protein
MSRHKHAYEEDDMYDYDDYEDEYYKEEHYNESTYETVSKDVETSRPAITEPPSDYVQFVMESLGPVEINASGTRFTGVISEARVLQMLEAYSFDIETTIDYFLKQRELVNTKPIVKPSIKPKELVSTNKKSNQTATTKQKEGKTTEALPFKVRSVAAHDMNAMGFASQNIDAKFTSIAKAPLGMFKYINT